LTVRLVTAGIAILLAGYGLGRYLRTDPPPLIIERSVNSPLSDLPVNSVPGIPKRQSTTAGNFDSANTAKVVENTPGAGVKSAATGKIIYICGARTKKGSPCQRHVHAAGERCFQHQGQPAMLPVEQLVLKGEAAKLKK
jgi:hypothetical protein